MARVRIVVSYARDRSGHPRGGDPEDRDATYWSNIAVQAATLRHVAHGDVDFVVCSTDAPAPGAVPLLEAGAVEIRRVEFAHRPPVDFYDRYLGSLYLFDAMAAMTRDAAPDDVLLFVDPDVVWVRDPAPLVGEAQKGGIVALDLGVPEDVPLCDLSRRDQDRIRRDIAGAHDGPAPAHFGGELYGMTGRELTPVLARVDQLWGQTIDRHERGLAHFHSEEHVMNVVLDERDETDRAGGFIQRIRTLPRPMGSRERAHDELVAWHLPLEKDKGFASVFEHLGSNGCLPEAGSGYRRWLRRRMGIDPVGVRWVADRARQVAWVLTRRERGAAAVHGL